MFKLFIITLTYITFTFCNESNNQEASWKLGYTIGKKISSNININSFLDGIKNYEQIFKNVHDEDYLFLLNKLQNIIETEKNNVNKQIAANFLDQNKKLPNVVEIVPGKVQYTVINEGKGDQLQDGNAPLINYKCFTIDNKLLYETKEPLVVSLDELIKGFAKGILGMKEKEKRIIYIHPDYSMDKDNRLIKFEVELVKTEYDYNINKSYISSLPKYIR